MTENDGAPIVLDNGSGTIKAGFSGKIKPGFIIPTVCGRIKSQFFDQGKKDIFFGKEALENIEIVDINNPVEHGIIKNWDFMERVWYNLFENHLQISPEKHPILLSDSPFHNEHERATMSQIMFETFNFPSLYFYNQSILSLYANNLETGIVVDLGYGKSSIVGFYEGDQMHSKSLLHIQGKDFNDLLIKLIAYHQGKADFETDYSNDIKEKLCFVSTDLEKDIHLSKEKKLDKSYKLPDGSEIIIGRERFETSEVLFQPSLIGLEDQGIHQQVFNIITRCKEQIQPKLYQNIVLCGGSSLFEGLDIRLKQELEILSKDYTVDIKSPSNRIFSPWIGGSMLSSLSSFKRQWISQLEYSELGTDSFSTKIKN